MNKKILILAANPKNTSNLRLDEEVREIKNILQLSPNRDEFQIITESAVRVDDLTRYLSNHQPTIVHFSGHGSGTDGLALEDSFGHIQLVSTKALAKLFDLFQQQVECVVLNACYSEEQADSIHQHIDCVVGMNQAIGDRAAIKFSVGFYTALAALRNYEDCFKTGCASIDLQGIPESQTPQQKIRRRASNHVEDNMKEGKQSESSNKFPQNMPQEKPSQSLVFNGSNSGQIGQAGGNLNQNQSNNQGGVEKQLSIAEVVELIEKMESLFSSSDLPDELKGKTLKHIDYAKEAVQEKEPDKNTAVSSLQKASKVLKEANETLGAGKGLWHKLKPIAKQLAPWLGIAAKNIFWLP
jgi:hypothetical protein